MIFLCPHNHIISDYCSPKNRNTNARGGVSQRKHIDHRQNIIQSFILNYYRNTITIKTPHEDQHNSCKIACFYLFSARALETNRSVSARTLHLKFCLVRARIGIDRGGSFEVQNFVQHLWGTYVPVPSNQNQLETVRTAARWGALHLA